MWYEINVSLNGQHFFGTHERSIINEAQLVRVMAVMLAKFPKHEGYEVTATRECRTGRDVTASTLAQIAEAHQQPAAVKVA